MTALAGFWTLGRDPESARRCEAMLCAQADCGPHARAVAESGELALGRGLFRILPEDAFDAQPLLSADGRFALVADSRLDNRDKLGAELGLSSARLADMADSHLLFVALQRWGESAVDRILGDFAFAFFDSAERSLLLARDPLGQRPLFYHRGSGFVAFASMPRGLHAAGVEKRAELETAARYLALLHPLGERSWHAGISRVEPGHVATLTPAGTKSRRYWSPGRRELRLPRFEDYVEAFRSELDAAVARRLRGAGDPVAAHLSGGWDSGAVAATAARLLAPEDRRLTAFTSVPRAAAPAPGIRFADEGPLAAATAGLHPNIEHVLLPTPERSAIADLARDSRLFERPLFNPCNQVWLSGIRSAAGGRGARVLLTGEIGNWTLSAAPGSVLADLVRRGRLLSWGREALGIARSGRMRLRSIAASSFGPWIPRPLWRRLARFSTAPEVPLRSALRRDLWPQVAEEQSAFALGLERPPSDSFEDARNALFEMDFGEYRKGVLAGWGIDKRDATADRRLIEFCFSLPLGMLMKDGVRRPLARAALSDRLPAQVLGQRAKGYQAADWHEALGRDREALFRLIDAIAADADASSVVDAPLLRRLVEDWPQGGWETPATIARYRIALLQGLAAGQFILAASGR
jgi:asparagine synthase (glutamine-hydrolysing)